MKNKTFADPFICSTLVLVLNDAAGDKVKKFKFYTKKSIHI